MHAHHAEAEDLIHIQQMADVGAGEVLAGITLAAGLNWTEIGLVEARLDAHGAFLRKGSAVPRHEIFVTTKVANAQQGYDSTLKAFDESMRRLDIE